MTKQKKSFLERITFHEDAEKMKIPELKEDFNKNFFDSEKDYHPISPAIPVASSPIEDGHADGGTEGQLTVDVYRTGTDIVIRSIVGGATSGDIDIDINNDMVTIRGVRKSPEEISPENYYYRECFWGSFSRSIILPEEVDAEKAEASLKNGILIIRLPKATKVKSKKIQVSEK